MTNDRIQNTSKTSREGSREGVAGIAGHHEGESERERDRRRPAAGGGEGGDMELEQELTSSKLPAAGNQGIGEGGGVLDNLLDVLLKFGALDLLHLGCDGGDLVDVRAALQHRENGGI